MNKKEHLLLRMAEECADIIKAINKSLLFGLKDGYPETGDSNEQMIELKFNSMISVVGLLKDEGVEIDLNEDCVRFIEKSTKESMRRAERNGVLQLTKDKRAR